ncbi:MAG: UDP-glucose/GDP-mannose dehydrogenase family protein [Actinobacteria bacterium]|nr:UDP-glucose/GDP-mannose dehydrogenase family protein [Actinomycetota bacterium]
MKVCVIGTGYVGLVTGVCLAEIEHNVICVDKDENKINMLLNGKMPIYEPGLDKLVEKNVKKKNLIFSSDVESAIKSQDIIFICVGTPPLPDGSADLQQVEEVAKVIGNNLNEYKIIVNKSTVPIGSDRKSTMIINDSNNNPQVKSDIAFDVVSNPEFLREGTAISDTFFPDRIVLGSTSKSAIDTMKKLYEPIISQKFDLMDISFDPKNSQSIPIIETDLVSAEMIKYAANSFLATKISYINEIANICEKAGADVNVVAHGIGLDSRIGTKFLNAGIGWGGSCFPKDVLALTKIAAEYGLSTQLLNSVVNVNNQQRLKVVQKVQETLKIVKGKSIGMLGISFKPNTDDTRDAPPITIMNNLVNLGAKVKAYDPIVKKIPETLNSKVLICASTEDIFRDSDLVILATEWEDFKDLNYKENGKLMKDMNFIDGRNFLDKEKMIRCGFNYLGIGR